MATKKTAKAEPAAEVTISRTALVQLVSIVDDLAKADRAYMNCQGSVFRTYAQSLYKAANTQKAVAQAKAALAEPGPEA